MYERALPPSPGRGPLETPVTIADPPPLAPVPAARRSHPVRTGLRLPTLAIVALLLGLTYAVGFLRPLSYWTLPDVIPTEQPLATALGTRASDSLRFIVPVVVAFVLYGAAVVLARGLSGRRAIAAVLGAGVLYAALFVPINPVGAQDIYHNVFDARILWKYGDNPNAVPPVAFSRDPLYQHVVAWAEFASVYGPVWYAVSGLPYAYGGDELRANVVGHKVLTAAFLLGTALLAARTAERVRRGSGAAAALAVAWNPLLLFETAGNAHNDIVMVFFAMAALYALAAQRWLLVFPLLALSVATKYGLILLGPLMLVWLLRRRDVPKGQVLGSLGLGAAVGLAVYLPFFQGRDTLDVIRRQSGYNTSSPSALLDAVLIQWRQMDPLAATQLMKLLVVPPFLLLYGWQVWRVRGDLAALVERSFVVLFLLLLIATWWFWPWYVLWLVPLAAVVPGRAVALVGLLFSASAMLMYAPYFWLLYERPLVLQGATAVVAFLPPVLVGLGCLLRRAVRRQRRGRAAVQELAPGV